MIHKLALGTVQFGIDYGINNSRGQVSLDESSKILNYCKEIGIDTLDTAHAYGESEVRLGKTDLSNFEIVSKLPPCEISEVKSIFAESINRLHTNYLFAYMLHNFSIYDSNPSIWDHLGHLKENGNVQNIGVSLYHPEELERLWQDDIVLDIVQVPYNLFDRRFEPYFPKLKSKGTIIHTRSTFLQGLFFKNLTTLPEHFISVKPKLEYINSFIIKNKLSTAEICLGFVLNNTFLDRVVIGVDTLDQLIYNVEIADNKRLGKIDWTKLEFLSERNETIINPALWKI